MTKYIRAGFFLTAIISTLNVAAQFKGGSSDGFDIRILNQLIFTNDGYKGGSGDGFAIASTDAFLPVSLMNFSAVYDKQSGDVLLQWQTATEINVSHFEVRHSSDNANWESICQVSSAGNSSTQRTYNAVHIKPKAKTNFYRLIIADKDGKLSYSNVQLVTIASGALYSIKHANPVNNSISIQLMLEQQGPCNLTLTNSAGQILQTTSISTQSGIYTLQLNVEKYPAGNYFLVLQDQSRTILAVSRFIKQ